MAERDAGAGLSASGIDGLKTVSGISGGEAAVGVEGSGVSGGFDGGAAVCSIDGGAAVGSIDGGIDSGGAVGCADNVRAAGGTGGMAAGKVDGGMTAGEADGGRGFKRCRFFGTQEMYAGQAMDAGQARGGVRGRDIRAHVGGGVRCDLAFGDRQLGAGVGLWSGQHERGRICAHLAHDVHAHGGHACYASCYTRGHA